MIWHRVLNIIAICAVAASITACSKSEKQGPSSHASGAAPTSPIVTPPYDSGIDFLAAGIKGTLYLTLSVGQHDGAYVYCKPEHGTPMDAQYLIQADSGKTPFIAAPTRCMRFLARPEWVEWKA